MAQASPFSPTSLTTAKELLRQQRWSEAEALLQLLAGQGDGEACSLLGHLCLHQRRGADAERCFRQALACGENAGRLSDLAGLLPARGAVEEARRLYTRALQLAPADAALHCALGRLLFPAGEKQAAMAELKKAVACDPEYSPAQLYLGVALLDTGDITGAREPLAKAIARQPGNPLAQYHYGVVCQQSGDIAGAITAYRAALSARPEYLLALQKLGECYILRDVPDKALDCFQRALSLKPGAANAHYGCGMALVRLNRGDAAVGEFRKAGSHPGAKVALAGALHAAGHSDEACRMFEDLCRESPDNAPATIGLADTLQALGRIDEAYAACLRAIDLYPDAPAYYRRALSLGDSYVLPEKEKASLLALAARADTLSPSDRGELNFALYHFYARADQDDAAMKALLAANAAKRAQVEYDPQTDLQQMEGVIAATPAPLLAEMAQYGNPSEVPIFVVGMPRSGTTLAEQILSSHPGVHGAGEIPDFGEALARVSGNTEVLDLATLSVGDIKNVAERYLERLHEIAPDARHVVDKLPWNFQLVGYIHALLPKARIIHARRNPLDTCFSCFMQSFRSTVPFCTDLTELGQFYREYDRMMAHWHDVLPEGTMLDLDYEKVVADFEPQVRRLLDFCGLEWDPACLAFYQNRRQVHTASAAQVRKPIYQSAVGRWKRYEAYLAPLKAALGPELCA